MEKKINDNHQQNNEYSNESENSFKVGLLGIILLIVFSIGFSSYLGVTIKLYFADQINLNLNEFFAKFHNDLPHLAKMDIAQLIIFFVSLLPVYTLSYKFTRYALQIFSRSRINYSRKSITQSSNLFFSKARGKDKGKAAFGTFVIFAIVAFSLLYFKDEYLVILVQGYLVRLHHIILMLVTPLGVTIKALGFDGATASAVAYLIVIFVCFTIITKYVFLASLFIVGQTTRCSSCKAVFAVSEAGIETIERFTEWKNETVTRNGKQYTEAVPYNVHRYWQYTSCDICNYKTRSEKVKKTKGNSGIDGFSAGREFGRSLVR